MRYYIGQLLNGAGRVIADHAADAYLAAYAAAPRTDPDILYAQVITRAGLQDSGDGEPRPDERSTPRGAYHHARDAAASRARQAGAPCYVWADGHAYVSASHPPARAAYCTVTPGGQWTRHLAGATEPLPGPPGPHDFSALSGQLAGPQPPAPAPGSPAGKPGQPEDRAAALAELAGRHGLAARPGEFAGEILIGPGPEPGQFALTQERAGAPLLNARGRRIPPSRADAYLAAYAASPGTDPDLLYAQAAAASPDQAAGERTWPVTDYAAAAGHAAARARESAAACYIYGDGMALVVTSTRPDGQAHYATAPDGRWAAAGGAAPVTDGPPGRDGFRSLLPGTGAGTAADPDPAPPAAASGAGDDPAPDPAAAPPGPAGPPGLVIEHGHGGTIVTGTSKTDRELHALLTRQSFSFSRARELWYLPRPWPFPTRDRKVRGLKAGLDRIGRPYTERDNPLPAAPAGPAAPLPAADPYPGPRELAAGCGAVLRAYSALTGTDAGRRLWHYETRPDVDALKQAAADLRALLEQGPPGSAADPAAVLAGLSGRLADCAAAGKTLQDNLAAHKRRAPKFDPVLDRFITTAIAAAARTAATAHAGGFPATPAGAAPPPAPGPGSPPPAPPPGSPGPAAGPPPAQPRTAPGSRRSPCCTAAPARTPPTWTTTTPTAARCGARAGPGSRPPPAAPRPARYAWSTRPPTPAGPASPGTSPTSRPTTRGP